MRRLRHKLLKWASMVGAGAIMLTLPFIWMGDAYAFYQTPGTVPLFVNSLRGVYPLDPNGIPVAIPDVTTAPLTGVTHYTIDINQYQDTLVPSSSGLGPTTLRGYNPVNALGGPTAQRHLGGIIIGKGRAPGVPGDMYQPIQITFRNNLPTTTHIIPNDQTILGANQGNGRTAVHFHGGLVPWISDGGPFDWWDKTGTHGLSFLNNILNPGAAANEAEYYYPLNQSARFSWYHDHAFGITRINAYAGIATALFIRDGFEAGLVDGSGGVAQGLPNYIEALGNEIPLVFQDKIFVGSNIRVMDPTWSAVSSATTPGSLWYAHTYERGRWRQAGGGAAPPTASIIPEFFGDTMLVNGTAFPKAAVEARRYRLRLLNACNARFLNLQFYVADASANGITLDSFGNPTNPKALVDPNTPGTGATILQIGSEGGFLPKPVKVPTGTPFNPVSFAGSLIVAPAERPDLLIDFSAYSGKSIILYNDAPAPFPGGDPRNDYFPGLKNGNPVNASTHNGFGPNSRVLMRFDVIAAQIPADLPLTITTATDLRAGNEPFIVPYGSYTGGVFTPAPGINVRQLTLNEAFDRYGRLIQMLGTTTLPTSTSAGYGRGYIDTPTEVMNSGDTEVWEIFNTTADVHPMHFHLVNVQVINRQPFTLGTFIPVPAAEALPAPNETGWKETVPMYPGTVTRIIMKFDLALTKITGPGPSYTPIDFSAVPNGPNPAAPNFGYGGLGTPPPSLRTGGAEYVWHCHILEHEEHDMMRPLIVK